MNTLLNTGLHVTGGTSPSFITNAILIFITMAMETAFCRTIFGYTTKKKVANKHKKLLPTKKIGRGWVAKHSKCWACNRSPNPAQNPSWVCFSLALTQIVTGVHLTTILYVLYYYIVYLNFIYPYKFALVITQERKLRSMQWVKCLLKKEQMEYC